MNGSWFTTSFRRHLCDMHIEDWNDEFLSEFSPEEYVRCLKLAQIDAPMLYFQSHVGLCYWPTKTARMHRAFEKEPGKMRRLVELCHKEGMKVVGYYSLNYNNWAHDTHPEWRMVQENGRSEREDGKNRYGLCCPNHMAYREFVFTQIREMAEYFSVEGMFYDMPFWPYRCYCDSCKARWAKEVGGDLPRTKEDPRWDLFMTKRQDWMGEWSQAVTDLTRQVMPGVSVEQNFASAVADRSGGNCVGNAINDACDYTGGDLYGGYLEQSFTCKYYASVTRNQPYEYMTCRCNTGLSRHTLTKSRDQLKLAVMMTCANHGATLLIDAIDPVGTLDERVYRTIGEIFQEEKAYEPYLSGNLRQDVGIYYSLKSKFNLQGQAFSNMSGSLNTFKTMVKYHVPVGIATEYQQENLSQYQVLVASNLNHTSPEMVDKMVQYVAEGGILYLSNADEEELLFRLTGGKRVGYTPETIVYMAPKAEHEKVCDGFSAKYPIQFLGSVPVVEGIAPERVLATITLPYTLPTEEKFASIHSNPPGRATEIPALALIPYGKGKVVWSAVPLEQETVANYRRILRNVLQLAGLTPTVTTNAPETVELVTFEKADGSGLQISAVHLNEEEEAITLPSFTVSVACETPVEKLVILPTGEELAFTQEAGRVTFRTRELRIFDMYELAFVLNT